MTQESKWTSVKTRFPMLSQFAHEAGQFLGKWFWCYLWHRDHLCFPEVWRKNPTAWHCSKCHPCSEGLLQLMNLDEVLIGRTPEPGEEGYGHWCWVQAVNFMADIRSPDMPVHKWLEMIHNGWMDYHELAAAVAACRDINDSGEAYSHPNADGSQALANLFSMVDLPQFDEADHPNPENPQ